MKRTLDLFDLIDRIRSFIGMLAILGVAVFLSDDRRAISGRVILWGLALQWGFALLVLRVPSGIAVLKQSGDLVTSVLDSATEGASTPTGCNPRQCGNSSTVPTPRTPPAPYNHASSRL